MIEGFLDGLDSSIEDLQKKFYGLCTGRVIALDDPWMLGRVQVQLPFIDSLDLQPWARVATPMASKFSGHYFIPQIRDEVLVGFEQGDTQVPYIIGSLWSAESMPPMQSPLAQIRAIRTMAGNQIVFTEAPPSIMIQTAPTPPSALPAPPSPTGPHQTIAMTPAGVQVTTPKLVQIMVGTTVITVSPSSVSVVVGSSTIAVTPASITMHASAISLVAEGTVDIKGATIRLNS